ncbi:hypothetical protein AB0I54_38820 [Streptomyces sp. NPDC050625]|uniref:hypothetical protein n=1 Tax=Streptomyces sp. NPDC050625 TaxID=3154629 RepID=UPI003425AD76
MVGTGGRRTLPDCDDVGGIWALQELLERYEAGERPEVVRVWFQIPSKHAPHRMDQGVDTVSNAEKMTGREEPGGARCRTARLYAVSRRRAGQDGQPESATT